MNKGDVTPNGTFIGERLIDRDPRITVEQLADLPKVYSDQAPKNEAGEPILDIFMDKAIAYVFEQQGEPVEVLEQKVGSTTIPGYTYTPPVEEVVVLAEDIS